MMILRLKRIKRNYKQIVVYKVKIKKPCSNKMTNFGVEKYFSEGPRLQISNNRG
jgi:hypothetical protein